jgi:ubiquinone/menaquinone biosynthesis C-methylase UbiE
VPTFGKVPTFGTVSTTSGVDYDHVAPRYQEGRALSEEALESIAAGLSGFVPEGRTLKVLDLGAGTGIFTRAWSSWRTCGVVAVEPSDGMRSEAIQMGIPPGSALMAGVGEHLALVDDSMDVAWLSTVLHHLRERQACAEELARVIKPGGALLIRGLFADAGEVGWLRAFPNAGSVHAGFPSTVDTVELFHPRGFRFVGSRLLGGEQAPAGEVARWVRQMRSADTLLRAFSDSDYQAGLAALEALPTDQSVANQLVLLIFVMDEHR